MLEVHLHDGKVYKITDRDLLGLIRNIRENNANWLLLNAEKGQLLVQLQFIDYIYQDDGDD